mgnify:CR=1 FL=1
MKKILILLFLFFAVVPAMASDSYVVFNVKTLVYHKPSCMAARRCTKSCVKMPKAKAIERGRPCEICGG